MIKNLVACFLVSLPLLTLAQSEPRLVGYFNWDWKQVQDTTKAVYYRTVEDQPGGLYLVKDYYMSGQLQMQPVVCTAYTPKLMWEGNTILYHKNGTVKEEGIFKNESRYGLHHYWYDNGNPDQLVWYDDNGKTKYYQGWTKSGKELLTNGNGVLEEYWQDHVSFLDIRDSVSIGSYSFNETVGDKVYLTAEKAAEYIGGFEKLYRGIAANMKYPKSARRAGIEGKVFVSFIVDENGRGIAHEILKGIGYECDEEAMRAMKLMNDWTPAVHRGRKVKMRFVLPITYRLD